MVVVDAQGVDGTGDDLEVSGTDLLLQTQPGHVRQHVGRIAASEDRVEEYPVELPVDLSDRFQVAGGLRSGRFHRRQIQSEAQAERRVGATECLDGEAVAEQEMVHGRQPRGGILQTRGVGPADVAEERRAPGLVQRGPHGHPVAQSIMNVHGVLAETVRGVPVAPAALVLDRLRQVPVVERQPRHDVVFEQLVDQPRVEVESGRVHRPAVGANPRPRRGEAIALHAQRRHDLDVLAVPVVVVAGHGAVVAVDDGAVHAAEGVPDAVPAAVDVLGTLDLERGGGGSEDEAVVECR